MVSERPAELCLYCGDATGHAGQGDGSLFVGTIGPFCDDCYSEATSEYEAELTRLRAEAERLGEQLHLRVTKCAVCECAILPGNDAPHCYTCIVHEEHQEAWEDAIAAVEPPHAR